MQMMRMFWSLQVIVKQKEMSVHGINLHGRQIQLGITHFEPHHLEMDLMQLQILDISL
ncbi:hypothetical protein D3C81_1691340 [compost metagenome]